MVRPEDAWFDQRAHDYFSNEILTNWCPDGGYEPTLTPKGQICDPHGCCWLELWLHFQDTFDQDMYADILWGNGSGTSSRRLGCLTPERWLAEEKLDWLIGRTGKLTRNGRKNHFLVRISTAIHVSLVDLSLGVFACSRPKFWENFRSQTLDRGEETLSSGWIVMGSELSSPNFNSSVGTERSFAIRYLNVVIKPLCGNLDICLNY